MNIVDTVFQVVGNADCVLLALPQYVVEEGGPAWIGYEGVASKEVVEIAEGVKVSVFGEKCGEVYLVEAIESITGLAVVEPPLPTVGQDAPVFIRVPQIGVDLVVWILIIKRVASVLRLSI